MTDPLALPTRPRIKASRFSLTRQQAFNPMRGGHHQAVDLGEALWRCEFETTDLPRDEGGAWRALLARTRGNQRTMLLFDAARPRPIAYHSTAKTAAPLASSSTIKASSAVILASAVGDGVAGWGAPQIVEVDRTNGRVRLTGLVAGATISPGDMGAWQDGYARRLHIILEAATADAAGEAWVSVEPVPPTTASAGALPTAFAMEKACGEFVVMASDAPFAAQPGISVTLQALQIIKRSAA